MDQRRRAPKRRLIPAHAGKTSRTGGGRVRTPAHPRSRGENLERGCPLVRGLGSSPLTRGKLRWTLMAYLRERLIPAHAGKTRDETTALQVLGAHPRSRGENRRCLTSRRTAWGSSPLTRGKRLGAERRLDTNRLIPAHAGKTSRTKRGARPRRAHPRSRGENVRRGRRYLCPAGSSPLTRGKRGYFF